MDLPIQAHLVNFIILEIIWVLLVIFRHNRILRGHVLKSLQVKNLLGLLMIYIILAIRVTVIVCLKYIMIQMIIDGLIKKWCNLNSYSLQFDGLLSTNKWSEFETALYSNQESYNKFYNTLSSIGYEEPLEQRKWITKASQN